MKKEEKKPEKKTGDIYKKKKIISITALMVGLLTLIAGVVVLVISLTRGPETADGEYLVSAGEWVLDDEKSCNSVSEKEEKEAEAKTETESDSESEKKGESTEKCLPSVVWKFTEIGKGTLTTNAHVNDYDFIWALEDGKLKIETKWLYDLNNEYDYSLDQRAGVLTLTDGDETFRFVANQ